MVLSRSLCAVLLGAVAFAPVRAEAPLPPPEVSRLSCAVDVRTAAVACAPVGDASVGLIASLPAADAAGRVVAVEVAVWNASAGMLAATADGTPDPAGIELRVTGPPATTLGAGVVSAVGPGSLGFDAVLAPGERSAVGALRFEVPEAVDAFTFEVSVRATITFPRGTLAVSPAALTLKPAVTGALAVAPRAPTGARLPGAGATFETADGAIATVNSTGTVTAVADGATTITVRSGAASASVPVTVRSCVTLALGEVFHTTLADGATVCVGAESASEYTVLPINQTASSLAVTLTGTGITGVTGPPSPIVPAGLTAGLGDIDDGPKADREGHLAALERNRQELAALPASALVRSEGPAAAQIIPTGVPTVGDSWTLNVAPGCSGTVDNRTGTVRTVSTRAIIVADDANPSGGFTTAEYDRIATEFDALAWPAVTDAFGAPTDLDGNGRVVLFFTRAVNELSPAATPAVTNGLFESRDLYSSAACGRSNEGEILYMLVPDPTGAVNGNVRTVSSVKGAATRTAGHELQHLTNASRRLYVAGASALEDPWLDEGLSDAAEELMFYKLTGLPTDYTSGTTHTALAPRQNVALSNLTSGPDASWRVAAFNGYANLNFSRLRAFLQQPGLRRPLYGPVSELGNRGALWAFLRYAADRRGGDENTFWAAFTAGTTTGTATLQAALGLASEAELLAWTRDWMLSVYSDDAVSGVAAAYTQPSWHYRSVFGGLGGFSLSVSALSNGTATTRSLGPHGSTAYFRAGVPASGTGTFRLDAPAAPGAVPVSILRTK